MEPTLVAPRGESPTSRLASLANGLVAVLAAALCFLDSGPLQWLAGTALALALPGDAIRRALGVARTGIAAAVTILSVSLATTVFVGLAVDQLSVGMTARSLAIGLLTVTFVADAAAFLPSPRQGPAAAEPVNAEPVNAEPVNAEPDEPTGLTWKHYAAAAALFAIPAGIGVTLSVRASDRHDRAQAGTALSIVQQNDTAVVEVIDPDPGRHSYVLDVTGGGVILTEQTVTLRGGSLLRIPVDISRVPALVRVTAALTPAGTTTPLRTVWLVSSRT